MAAKSDGFKLIADYSSSSDESNDESNFKPLAKRLCVDKTKYNNLSKPLLPVPESLLSMFGDIKDCESECNKPDGRIRTFPHQRGNWATYLYIPCEMFQTSSCEIQLQKILNTLKPNADLHPIDHFHISVSRTFVLQHHWIDPLVGKLKKKFNSFTRFPISFQSARVYTNEEKTRTFLGLQVDVGHSNLVLVTAAVDSCLEQFKLPAFYKEASFHVSIAWCLGDQLSVLQQLLPDFHVQMGNFLLKQARCGHMTVDAINMKTGNKTFNFQFENVQH